MQERLRALWQFLVPRLRIVMVLVFLGLLGLVCFLKSSERLEAWTPPPWKATPMPTPMTDETVTPETPTPAPTPAPAGAGDPMAALKEDKGAVEIITKTLYARPLPVEKTPYAALIAHSMFSIKTVQDQAGHEEVIKDLYEEAGRLRDEKKFAASLAKCNELLAIRPNHIQALDLKQKLQKEMGGPVR